MFLQYSLYLLKTVTSLKEKKTVWFQWFKKKIGRSEESAEIGKKKAKQQIKA